MDFWEDDVTNLRWEMYKNLSSLVQMQTMVCGGGYHYSVDPSFYLPKAIRKLHCIRILFV